MKPRSFAVLLITALLPFPVAAQTTFGSVTGMVTDPSGAVIPAAIVIVTNEGTGLERHANTSDSGVFNVPNLNVGPYRVRVEAAGFQPQERTGLVLNANQVINVNIEMAVAAATATAEVVGSAAVVDTETSTLSYVKTSKDMEQLPLVSRSAGDQGFYGYTLLNPGVNKVSGQSN